jgi:GNAT superfamily N-acetyltransferase
MAGSLPGGWPDSEVMGNMTRPADLEDLPAIVALKLQMFAEEGLAGLLAEDADKLVLTAYKTSYANGTAQHFIIEDNRSIVACVGAFLKDDLPYCFFRRPVYGFIGDVYTHPDYRRRGYARQLTMDAIQWLKSQGVEMVRLLASSQARPLYTAFGFQPTDEMVLWLH